MSNEHKISISDILLGDDYMLIYRDILSWFAIYRINENERDPTNENKSSVLQKFSLHREMVLQDSFRLTELGNWLLQYHKPFREEYQGSNIPKSYRLHSKRTFIENKIDELIRLNLIGSKEVQSAKNNTSTKEYFFSNIGILFSYIIIGKIEKDEKMRIDLIIEFFLVI